MSGYDDRMETQRIADSYEVTRLGEPDPGPLLPRVKQGMEYWGIASMLRAFWINIKL